MIVGMRQNSVRFGGLTEFPCLGISAFSVFWGFGVLVLFSV